MITIGDTTIQRWEGSEWWDEGMWRVFFDPDMPSIDINLCERHKGDPEWKPDKVVDICLSIEQAESLIPLLEEALRVAKEPLSARQGSVRGLNDSR